MAVAWLRSSVLLVLMFVVGVVTLLGAAPAVAVPVWEGGRVECRPDEQVRLIINYRGTLYIRWGEEGGMNHRAGPYRSALGKPLTYDTGAPTVVWRAEVKPDNGGIPGDIGDARATCVSES